VIDFRGAVWYNIYKENKRSETIMELWVRTADRRNLLKPTNIGLGWNCNSWGVYDVNQVLGEYKTEERCLEIIDDIQNLLVKSNPKEAFLVLNNVYEEFESLKEKVELARKNNFIAICDGSIEVAQPTVLVYEMPQE
jgi:hypothetical protein